MDPSEEKKYKLFDEFLKDISDKINRSSEEKNKHMVAFDEVFGEFRKKLIAEHPFFEVFKEIKPSGSNANGTKIGDADEFDMMICFKIPKHLNVEIYDSQYPAYVQLETCGVENLKKLPNYEKQYKCIEQWLDFENFILQNKFRNWMESIIQKTLNRLHRNILRCGDNYYSLTTYKSNPAFRLNVKSLYDGAVEFDVDLVPNFYFNHPIGFSLCEQEQVLKYAPQDWFLIAKRVHGEEDNRHWRVVFPEQEKEILHGKNHLKSTIRFMKQLRDKHEMPDISSYFIQTIFLWEVDQQSPDFWNKRLSFLFMHMLHRLRSCLEERSIPYFWHSQLNLLEKLTPKKLDDHLRKINNIFKAIDKYYPERPEIIINILEHGSNKLYTTFREDSNNQSLRVWNPNSYLELEEEEESEGEYSNYHTQSYSGNQNQMDRSDAPDIATSVAIGATVVVGVAALGLGLWYMSQRRNDRR